MTLRKGYQVVSTARERADEFLEVDGWAFASTPQVATEDELKNVLDWDRARGIEVTDPAIAEPGTLVAVHSSHPYDMRVPGGGTVRTTGLTWVGVHSAHRRRGLLTEMIADHFARGLARGEVVSTLYAAETAIYQRFGYGLACQGFAMNTGRAPELREVAGSDDLRLDFENANVDQHGAVVLAVLARVTRPGTHTTIDAPLLRDTFLDPELWREGAEKLRIAVVRDADGPAAFAIFNRKGGWEDGEASGVLSVWTWAAANAAAERRLFSTILDMDLVTKVKVRNIAGDSPLVHLLKDIRGAHLALRDNIWLRVLDVPKALSARGYSADAELILGVTDAQLPANAGLWRLTIANGTAHVARENSPSAIADVQVNAQELGAAYLGGVSFATLADAGLVTGAPDAINALSRAFVNEQKPVSPLSF